MDGGLQLLTGGTDNHLLQLDLRSTEWSGKDAEERLHEVAITVNRNTVPYDERPPTIASGVRIGTPAATMRGLVDDDMREVGADHPGDARPGRRPAGAARAHARAAGRAAAVPGLRARPPGHLSRPPMPLTVVDHPLVQHKLGLLRDRATTTRDFRQLAGEIAAFLCYEATRDLELEPCEVETPLERTDAARVSGKKLGVVAVLRAGVGMLDAVLDLMPVARVGFVGIYRDEQHAGAGRVLQQAARRPRPSAT